MPYIVLGAAGFLIAYLFDLQSLSRARYARQVVGLSAVVLLATAHIVVSTRGEQFALPNGLTYAGWPLFILATLALVYSLFVEIPLKRTYFEGSAGDRLVTSGTYALVRHPGVLWYALFLLAMVIVSRRYLASLAAPVWLAMDVLYVWIQERFFFKRMFPGYAHYQSETPMLIPTRDSIRHCVKTFSMGRGRRAAPAEEPGAGSETR